MNRRYGSTGSPRAATYIYQPRLSRTNASCRLNNLRGDANIIIWLGSKGLRSNLQEIQRGKSSAWNARIEKRNAILAALSKARGETLTACDTRDELTGDNQSYFTLTREELEALVNGNIEKVENWVSNLDRRHATWLLRWLIKESG
jgi:hypothetical protein